MSFTPEQLAQIIAAQAAAAQPAAAPALSFAAPRGAQDPTLAALQQAATPTDRLQSLSHPEGAPLANGRGAFDGEYAITIDSSKFESTRKGQRIFKVVFAIDESTNLAVPPGTYREHPLFQWIDAAISETKGVLQKFYAARGGSGDWSQSPEGHAFYYAVTSGEGANPAKGLRFRLSVSTEPQRGNASKSFTHLRYGESLAPGQSLGLVASQVPAPMAPVVAAPPVAAPVAPAAAGSAPPWWPAGLPLPPGGVPF